MVKYNHKKERDDYMAVKITKNNFNDIINSNETVLLDFWATWCGPCQMIGPIIEQVAEENTSVVVGKVNVDEERDLAVQFGITAIPTLVAFKNGKVSSKEVGFINKPAILNMIK